MTHADLITALINPDFNFRSFVIGGVKCSDHYSNVNLETVRDIYVENETPGMSVKGKYEALANSRGWIHVDGFSFEVKEQQIKSFCLKDVAAYSKLTRSDVENILGSPDKILVDGTTWVADFVEEAKVMVYERLSLHIHLDPDTADVIEIQFGDIDTTAMNGNGI